MAAVSLAHPGMATRALGHMSAVKMAAGGQRQWRKFSRRSRLLHITALAARRKNRHEASGLAFSALGWEASTLAGWLL